MSETKSFTVGMPATEEGVNPKYMKAGLHLVKVLSISQYVDDKDVPKTDKNGNPGLKVVFANKDGETIDGIYYYSTLPLDDPKRREDQYKCKSEFKLHALKRALGFGTNPTPMEEIRKKKIWLVVILQEYFDTAGKPVFNDKGKAKKFHQVGDVYPYDGTSEGHGRPVLKGDPRTDADNFLTGVFYEKKVTNTMRATNSEAILSEDQVAVISDDLKTSVVDGSEW
jgi:hypothetical protein